MISVTVVIPALDEEGALPGVIREARGAARAAGLALELVLVDDGSRDGTAAVMEAARAQDPERVRVVRHDRPRGCHPSAVEGFALARGDWVAFLPADGQVPPSVLGDLLAGGTDIVVGVRARRADPLFRRLISRAYALGLRLLLGIRCRDADSATLYRREPLQRALGALRSDSACLAAELLWRMTRAGATLSEVEIPHLPRASGRAKGVNLKDALGVPRNLLSLAVSRLSGS